MDETISRPCEQCDVATHPIFQILEREKLDFPQSCKACLYFPAQTDVLTAGSEVKGVFCVKKGKVKIFRFGESGKEQIIRFAKPGDVLGFRTLVSGQPLKVTATTLEETSFCFIDRDDFLKMMNESVGFRERVLREISEDLSEMVEALTDMAQRSVRSRLCSALIQLSDTMY
ncbi:MAG: Crp/Fnr family transcriptional regulator, partial [Flavobacteriales bacterium]|nr:Crp/Fnr family transcriptional regulator [Flavobacteriales bacterium]